MLGALTASCQQQLSDLDGVFYDGDSRLCTAASTSTLGERQHRERRLGARPGARPRRGRRALRASPWRHRADREDRARPVRSARPPPGVLHLRRLRALGRRRPRARAVVRRYLDRRVVRAPPAAAAVPRRTRSSSAATATSARPAPAPQDLAGDGHDIEPTACSTCARRSTRGAWPQRVPSRRVDPSIEILRNDGYEVHAFATRSAPDRRADDAIAKRVPILRSVAFTYMLVQSPARAEPSPATPGAAAGLLARAPGQRGASTTATVTRDLRRQGTRRRVGRSCDLRRPPVPGLTCATPGRSDHRIPWNE